MITKKQISEEFDTKFKYCFNIGVVPDNQTKLKIKQYLFEKIKQVVDELIGEEEEINYELDIITNPKETMGQMVEMGKNLKRNEIIKLTKNLI